MRRLNALVKGLSLGFFAAMIVGGVTTIVLRSRLSADPSNNPVEPSEKARVLAESISEGMNTGAFAAIVLMPAFVFWMVRRDKKRRP